MNLRVGVYITAYEDEPSLNECIECIFRQTHEVEKIFIVDNSENKLNIFREDSKVVVSHRPENIGISGGIATALDWAEEEEFDFLWTFDQDSQPLPECLDSLIKEFFMLESEDMHIGIIAPVSIDTNTGVELPGGIFDRYKFTHSHLANEDTYECDVVITSGSLVSMSAARKTQRPDSELFIDAVDWDYCMKFKKAGYKIFTTNKAAMYHCLGEMRMERIPLWNRKVLVSTYNPIRRYYICRNHTYLTLQSSSLLFQPIAVLHRLLYLLYSSMTILLFEDKKNEKIRLGVIGTLDGLLNRLGKREGRKLWHIK